MDGNDLIKGYGNEITGNTLSATKMNTGKFAQYILKNPAKWELDKLNGGIGNQVMESRAVYDTEAWMV